MKENLHQFNCIEHIKSIKTHNNLPIDRKDQPHSVGWKRDIALITLDKADDTRLRFFDGIFDDIDH